MNPLLTKTATLRRAVLSALSVAPAKGATLETVFGTVFSFIPSAKRTDILKVMCNEKDGLRTSGEAFRCDLGATAKAAGAALRRRDRLGWRPWHDKPGRYRLSKLGLVRLQHEMEDIAEIVKASL